MSGSIDTRRRVNAFQQRAMSGKAPKGKVKQPVSQQSSALSKYAVGALVFVVLGGVFFELARLIFL